jgi:hypothetical protein
MSDLQISNNLENLKTQKNTLFNGMVGITMIVIVFLVIIFLFVTYKIGMNKRDMLNVEPINTSFNNEISENEINDMSVELLKRQPTINEEDKNKMMDSMQNRKENEVMIVDRRESLNSLIKN